MSENIEKEALVKDCIKLGFGLMRLPHVGKGTLYDPIDMEETKKMVDEFIHAGGKYFDTAFIYPGSEAAAKEALCDRYPRDAYYLATKLNASSFACKNAEEAKAELQTSLERTGCKYFDFYLLNGMEADNLHLYEEYGLWEYMQESRKQGLVKHIGFSFHDKPELLDRILTEHPEAEFVQLQINYSDWEDAGIQAKNCYEVAVKHGKSVVVMEPVKGGLLANPPQQVKKIFEAASPTASPASWAIRFVASLEQVMIVLSGMSNEEQMKDNLSYMKNFKPLSESEQAVVNEARKTLLQIDRIPCTACHYCTPGCPVKMHIPEIFAVMNVGKMYGDVNRAKSDYTWRAGATKASQCIGCRQCEKACPQHLPIVNLLKEVADTLE